MNAPTPSTPSKKAAKAFRNMGMSLCIAGAVLLAAGLVVLRRNITDQRQILSLSILAVGAAMLIAGIAIWRNTRKHASR